MGKPRLLVLQGPRNFNVPTYVESDAVREHFDVRKSSKITGDADLLYCQAYGNVYEKLMRWGGPMVIHAGGSPWLELKGRRLKEVTDFARKATRLVCNSRFLEGVYKEHLKTDNICRLPDGLWGLDHTPIGPMPARFSPKERYSTKGVFNVVMSINLVFDSVKRNKWAGIPVMIDALKNIPAVKDRRVRFLCACKGSRRFPPLEEWQQDCSFSYVSQHHLADKSDHWPGMLRGADLFIHPSLFDCWPRAVADAMLTAVPGIVFNATGNAEVSDDVILADPNKPETIRWAFESLLLDESMREGVGKRMHYEALRRTEEHRGDYAKLLLEVLGD